MTWLKSWNPFKKKDQPQEPSPPGKTTAMQPQPPAGMMGMFYRKWKDPAFIKQLKTLTAHMAKEGVAVKDVGQVKAWLEKNKEAIEKGAYNEPPQGGVKQETYVKTGPTVGRNDPCTCASGKKYKKCCGKNA